MKAQSGFTLVEILIVVVILGILAAIVIPQFTEASTEAKTSSLVSDLQTMRSQIELYKIQHNDALPGAGTASLTASLTQYTDVAGALAATQAPGAGVYGPYLQKIPRDQFNNAVDAAGNGTILAAATTPAAADNSTSWFFNTATGEVRANDTVVAAHWGL
jgi:general secretion pathway protein G